MDELIDDLDESGTKVTHIAVVGGIRKSPFFIGQIKAKYSDSYQLIGGDDDTLAGSHVVANGAQLRYNDIKAETPEPVGFFGIEQDELYDESVHGDISGLDPRHIDIINGETYVKQRWQPINKHTGEL